MSTTTEITGTEGIIAAAPGRPMSFGEQAVGLDFNPSSNPAVYQCKSAFARVIDQMHDLREASDEPEVKRMASEAITNAKTAQMWAVGAVTWKV